MCGFVGYTSPAGDAEYVINNMLDSIQYRGPDQSGMHISNLIALGHARLSIVDPDGGQQPRVCQKSGNTLVYNGEIYSYNQHIDILRTEGVVLDDDSDTEVLFSYLKKDSVEEVLCKLDGMFSFAYFDVKNKTLTLARDRFGEKPLFYAVCGNDIVFASELSALCKHPLLSKRQFIPAEVTQFLWFEYLPSDNTGIDGIKKLPPGHMLTWCDGKYKLKSYWNPVRLIKSNKLQNKKVSEKDKIDKLDQLLSESIKERLIADVPVGVFLSGGIDSSLIAAYAKKYAADITAFTVKMYGSSYDESEYAIKVAKHLGVNHHLVELGEEDLINAFDTVFDKLTDFNADPSLIPTYLVCRVARQHVKVALGGDGADELFAGYPNFLVQKYSSIMSLLPEQAANFLRSVIDILPHQTGYMNFAYKLRQLSYGFGKPKNSQSFYWMASFTPDEQKKLWSDKAVSFDTEKNGIDLINSFTHELNENDSLSTLLYLFTKTYLPDDILTKVDRASMYNSLEVRAPFLSKNFSEYVLSLPGKDKLRGDCGKYLLKKLAERYLPSEIIHRKKHGFAIAVDELIRTKLKTRFESVLFDDSNPIVHWFNKKYIHDLWDEHQSTKRDHRKKIWTLYTLMRVSQNINNLN